MPTISFQLVTPEKTVLSQELTSLSCPTKLGEITILPNHEPLVAELAPGEIQARSPKGESFIFVAGGFVEVRANNEVVVLADAAEHHYEIDLEQAEAAKQRAQKALAEKQLSGEEYARVAASLQQNLARLNVARRHAQRRAPVTSQGTLNE